MSYHAQLSPEAEARLKAQRRQSNLASLGVSILVIILIGLVLALVVFQPLSRETPVIVSYSSPSTPEQTLEPKKQTSSRQNKPSAPSAAMSKVIAANVAAPTAVPVPDVAVPDVSLEFGTGDDFGAGWGQSGDGDGATVFGSRGGTGLTGTFIDLKQTREGEPTDLRIQDNERDGSFDIRAPVNGRYDEILQQFVKGGMSRSGLGAFFNAPQPLFIRQFYVPRTYASEAPKAFEVDDQVKGRRWVVVYRGNVVAPETGNYRFAGFCDDVMVVRFDGEIVLDAGLQEIAGTNRRNNFQHHDTVQGWPTYVGSTFRVPAGFSREIEIMVGERPGGHFSGYLLIEKIGEDFEEDEAGAPKLPLFKLGGDANPPRGETLPALGKDQPWSVWSIES